MDNDLPDIQPVKRGRGRPKGSGNKKPIVVVPDGDRETPPGFQPMDDYRHADPLTMISRNYAMLDWAQQALRVEMKRGLGADKGMRVSEVDIAKLLDLSNTLLRMLDAHKRAIAVAEDLAKAKTPAELLEISIRKIEGQDLPTLQAVIRRLREHRARLAPVTRRDSKMMEGVFKTAVSAIEALGEDSDDTNNS